MPDFCGKLLVTDLDGTLLDREGRLSPENREAIFRFIRHGGYFTASTGRSRQSFESVRRIIPANAPVILLNGGLIIELSAEGERVVYMAEMPPDAMDYMEHAADVFPDIGIETYRLDGIFSYNPNEYTWKHFDYVGVTDRVTVCTSLGDMPRPFNKTIFTQEGSRLREFAEWFSKLAGERFELVFSSDHLYEMQPIGINKAYGVRRLAEIMGIEHKNIFTAGDQENDLSMIEAFYSFAPANAVDIVKEKASHIVSDCDNHAIRDVVDILEGL